MTGRKFLGQQFGVALAKIGAGDEGDFVPAVPINLAICFENSIKPGFIEWHGCFRVPEQLCKLAALEFKHPLRRPELAFHQHFVDAFPEVRRVVHASSLNYKTCLLPMLLIRASMGTLDAPRDGACTPHTDGP